jgi:hypothetical protein
MSLHGTANRNFGFNLGIYVPKLTDFGFPEHHFFGTHPKNIASNYALSQGAMFAKDRLACL